MVMDQIIRALEIARDEFEYGYVEVTIPGQEETEIIINKAESLDNKIAYYKKAYGCDGVHCMNDRIRIVSAGGVNGLYLDWFYHEKETEE